MATETAQPPVNGHYNSQHGQPYDAYAQPSHLSQAPGPSSATAQSTAGPTTTATETTSQPHTEISKDEVGWYFVEQYYTTLSRSPEKLHLFYSKRSQFVSGVEAEKVSVSVGQKSISDRIKSLDIQDCKVRVLNVDSQSSFQNIVVQVIGEISNKSAPHRKFVQTFVLAEQPNGYFVLNDIFRYLAEEEEEIEQEAPEQPPAMDPTTTQGTEAETSAEKIEVPNVKSSGSLIDEGAAEAVDAKLEHAAEESAAEAEEPLQTPNTNGEEVDEAPVAPVVGETVPAANVSEESKEDETTEPEKPKEPEPTPIVSPPKAATPTPVPEAVAPAPVPKAPKSWASLVAANRAPPPAVPTSTSPAPQPKPAAPVTQSKTPPTGPSETTPTQDPAGNGSGWQTAGDHNKRQSRPQATPAGEAENREAYIKNVNEKVDAALLKETLQKYGKLSYFDVNRMKSCAFVVFATAAGYKAAVEANPHQIGPEQIYVEERRRAGQFGGNNQYGNRGAGRGRGGPDSRSSSQGRGGFQKDAGRGGAGYGPRGGRGGNVTPKGRGQAQAV